jgi:folate-binding protein YgfZ
MSRTPLQDAILAKAANSPLEEVEYRGATVTARFSDGKKEFAALETGCAIYDLGFRARISLAGGDRMRWLNGMVTNNIRDLAPGRGVYAFLLNAQGRILGDMQVYNLGPALEVETDRAQLEKILATFDHFIIMDDVEVANLSGNRTALGLAGPKSREVLLAAGIEFAELQPLQFAAPQCNCDCGCVACTVVRGETVGGEEDEERESYEIWLAPKDVYPTWRALVAAGATPVGGEAQETWRIAAGIPLYGVDIGERDLPQETGQTRALNFNKGCYVGQEIVERIHSRGNVHRAFAGFVVEGAAGGAVGTAAGEKIVVGEKEVGQITSAAAISFAEAERTIALGYIRREAGTPGRELMVGARRAVVARLPLPAAGRGMPEGSLPHAGLPSVGPWETV